MLRIRRTLQESQSNCAEVPQGAPGMVYWTLLYVRSVSYQKLEVRIAQFFQRRSNCFSISDLGEAEHFYESKLIGRLNLRMFVVVSF